ncbi:MAG: hypothetical protein J6P74_06265 [Paludibacteraceae bacterium]|nr:hypothetical protein [Paludibacteraceae bacterium]
MKAIFEFSYDEFQDICTGNITSQYIFSSKSKCYEELITNLKKSLTNLKGYLTKKKINDIIKEVFSKEHYLVNEITFDNDYYLIDADYMIDGFSCEIEYT